MPAERPDRLLFVEPFLAWRAWSIKSTGSTTRLESIVYKHVWEPGVEVRAKCMRTAKLAEHPAPDEDCKCGIYGSVDVNQLRAYVQETHKTRPNSPPTVTVSHARVFGLVSLWGTLVECSQGFRAQFAYPHSLYLPCRMHDHAGPLGVYGVPVTCVDDEHGFEALLKVVRQVRGHDGRGAV